MGNTLITPTQVANEALAILRSNLVYKNLVHTDFSPEFIPKVGATVNVRVPASLTAQDFVQGTNASAQDVTETYVPVVLNRHKDVTVALTTQDKTLKIRDFAKQIIEPAVIPIAEAIDTDIAVKLYEKAASSVSGNSSSTDLTDIAGLVKKLDINKAPTGQRSLVVGPEHKYRYIKLPNLSYNMNAGDDSALRRADMGDVYGLRSYMSQLTPASSADTPGTLAAATYNVASGDTDKVDIAAASIAEGTYEIGDGFIYNGTIYRFTTNGALTSNAAANIATSPAFPANVASIAAVVLPASSSLAFHRNALALATRTLELPEGAAKSAIANFEGISIRVVYDYDWKSKSDIISFDVLYGVKELRTGLIAKLVG